MALNRNKALLAVHLSQIDCFHGWIGNSTTDLKARTQALLPLNEILHQGKLMTANVDAPERRTLVCSLTKARSFSTRT